MTFAFLFLFSSLGGFISRLHGGGFMNVNRWLRNALWSLPFAVLIGLSNGGFMLCVLTFVLCFLGKTTGHGQYFLSRTVKKIEPEKIDFLIKPFFGSDPRTKEGDVSLNMAGYGMDKLYRRNVTGLCVGGLFSVLGAVCAMLFISPLCALILATGGALKGAAYMIGYKFASGDDFPLGDDFNEDTEIGEFLTGVFAFFAIGICYV